MPTPVRLIFASLTLLATAASAGAQDNVLLVVLDDVGVDRVRAYGEHPSPAPTPVIDALAADGVLFRTCWSNPLCSSTRATVLTGRYGFRTGIGYIVTENLGTLGLDLAEWTIPEVLDDGTGGGYRTAMIGKWHVSSLSQGSWNAMDAGFELYAGALFNLGPEPGTYSSFKKTVPGGSVHVDRYATTDEVDDALRAIASFGDDPWFVKLAFHAAHKPYHAPPPDLHDRPLTGDPEDTPIPHHKAMVQAMDSELGRLLAAVDPAVLARTTVLVVGDNGTQAVATQPPFDPEHAKGTCYEGGVRVPLIAWGSAVAPAARGQECHALVNTTDLFATVAELCGVDARAIVPPSVPLDSVSFAPQLADPALPSRRRFAYAERFRPNHPEGVYTVHERCVRNARFKLIRSELEGRDEFYDLASDPGEHRDLVPLRPAWSAELIEAYLRLDRRLDTLVE